MSYRRDVLAQAGKRTRAAMAKAAVAGEARDIPRQILDLDPLRSVHFASPTARKLAEKEEMGWKDFARSLQKMSSQKGYTTADVRGVLKENEEE